MEAHRRDDDDFAAPAGTVMEDQVCATDIAWASTAGLNSSTDCGGVKSESISSIIDVNDILDNSFCVTQSIVDPTSNSTTSGDHSSIMEHSHTMCTGSTTTTTTTTTTSNSFAYSAHTEPDSPLDSIAVHPSRGPPDAKHVPARKAATSSVTTPSSSHRGMKEMYMLVFDNGKLLGGKTIMAASTALFSVALVVCAVALRAKTRQAVKMPSGVLLGSIGTVVMACIVCVSYLLSPGCRRHSNILLLNRSVMDLLLALSFLLQPAWNNWHEGSELGMSCQYVSAVREYFIMTSVAWEFCMAVDLFSLLNDPFTSPRKNRGRYQLLSHGLGILAGGVMLTSSSFYGMSVGDFCWVKCSGLDQRHFGVFDAGVWIFIAVPVVCFISTNIYVCAVSAKRFRSGIEATLEHRRGLLREGFLTTVAFIVYWLLLWGVYIGFWLAQSDWEILQELFGFLLSFRGSVVFFLWILYSNTSSRSGEDRDDDATRAQTNFALLNELVFYTTRGITKAVQAANKRQALELAEVSIFTVHPPQNEHALYSCQECKFTDIRPDAFTHVRELFGVDETELISAFSNCSIPKLSEGASGSFMFFTSTGAFIVKSVTRRESAFLSSIVDQYAAYVVANPGTFITRIIGSYAMVLYGRVHEFITRNKCLGI
ncbi:hypothetical protein, variant [Aphanomyces astaci]|uniref:PIPK domain-containing protein n=1 Tax=Aphanomyces astaci TaxID=112090 RepID=W4GP37_APHAT|nr:hypothetical protein, variant [Aphanomyces astaci]ETV81086.1 hypothetical protein, variant [Aphanomyces astaci]|eukprot:XP_009828944.1 hypothetical protein, variant [Aphanomyces astaci]